MARAKYKPLSFSTTMRNPERIASFLSCMLEYENQNLTNDLIDKIVKKIIKKKLYCPNYIIHNIDLKTIYDSEENEFNDNQIDEIIANSPQDHKEAGFDKGWPSRFDTWFKLQKEFGFIWYEIDKPIEISITGHMLIDAVNSIPEDNEKIEHIFLNSMIKYQANNPLRKTLNSNIPLILLLNVINRFKSEDENSTGIFRPELAFFICWPNSDDEALFNYIKEFRQLHQFSEYTDEIIYNACLNNLGYSEDDKKYIKQEKVSSEAIDEYIRKMKITGILSLRGNGRFLDFNTLEIEKINYILNLNIQVKTFESDHDYFIYMNTIDNNLFNRAILEENNVDDLRISKLNELANSYTKEYVLNELKLLCKRKESTDPILKFINAPTRLEFLISLSLIQNFSNLDVKPNYSIDDEGLPKFTAAGGIADIVCYDVTKKELVEVTLMNGRQQLNNELIPISRHLKESLLENINTLSVFIAPTIHDDAKRYIKFIKFDENLDIKAMTITDFIENISMYNSFETMIS